MPGQAPRGVVLAPSAVTKPPVAAAARTCRTASPGATASRIMMPYHSSRFSLSDMRRSTPWPPGRLRSIRPRARRSSSAFAVSTSKSLVSIRTCGEGGGRPAAHVRGRAIQGGQGQMGKGRSWLCLGLQECLGRAQSEQCQQVVGHVSAVQALANAHRSRRWLAVCTEASSHKGEPQPPPQGSQKTNCTSRTSGADSLLPWE
eukprot:355645-Chlamydomonas_euryale.AAC.5